MRWVAEGYSRDTKDTTAEEKGEIFSMLVNLSMIQPPMCKAITHMRMIQCQVSAFFHEYIISRPDEENIIFALEVFALMKDRKHRAKGREEVNGSLKFLSKLSTIVLKSTPKRHINKSYKNMSHPESREPR
jgi:hypothetical protein